MLASGRGASRGTSAFSKRRRPAPAAVLCLGLAGVGARRSPRRPPRPARRSACSPPPASPTRSPRSGSAWEAASGHHAVFNFGASSDLSRQIRAGAPADVFFSADTAQMDALEQRGAGAGGGRARSALEHAGGDRARRLDGARQRPARPRRLQDDRTRRPAGGAGRRLRAHLARGPGALAAARATRGADAPRARGARRRRVRERRGRHRLPDRRGRARSAPGSRSRCRASRGRRSATRWRRSPLEPEGGGRAFVAYLRSPAARAVFTRHGFLVLEGR